MAVLPACLSVYHGHARSLPRPECLRAFGSGFTDTGEPPCGRWESELGPLEEQPGLLITAFSPGLIIAILKINYAFKYIKSIIILEKWINSHTPLPPAPAPHILPSAWPRWVTEANTESGSRSVSNWLRGHAMWLLHLALCWADPFPCSKGTTCLTAFWRWTSFTFVLFCKTKHHQHFKVAWFCTAEISECGGRPPVPAFGIQDNFWKTWEVFTIGENSEQRPSSISF